MLKRTPILAIFIACIITISVKYIFELPSRPFTDGQHVALLLISFCIALGIALFFDPKTTETTKKLSEINFYEEK